MSARSPIAVPPLARSACPVRFGGSVRSHCSFVFASGWLGRRHRSVPRLHSMLGVAAMSSTGDMTRESPLRHAFMFQHRGRPRRQPAPVACEISASGQLHQSAIEPPAEAVRRQPAGAFACSNATWCRCTEALAQHATGDSPQPCGPWCGRENEAWTRSAARRAGGW
jgi:hypothetical protein